jgi:aldose 1-epimerase
MSHNAFNAVIDGKQVGLYTLKNKNGVQCSITNYGGRIVSITAPDKDGILEDVVLGYDDLQGYLDDRDTYFGAIIGRVANRISGAAFCLDGKNYELSQNDGKNHIHGGYDGFHCQVWKVERCTDKELVLSFISHDGQDGYPGTLLIDVVYSLNDQNALEINYTASSDQTTPVNITNHTYFNLKGAGKGTIEDHELMIQAGAITPIGEGFLPTGEIMLVEGTPFDFRNPRAISNQLDRNHPQLIAGKGFDHNFIIDGSGLRFAAKIADPVSGRVLETFTTQPGMQFYSGNFLKGNHRGKRNLCYPFRSGFCMETQHFPDSVNRPEFHSIWIHKDEVYAATCIYRFSVQK